VNDASREQGQANPSFSVSYSGFVLGDDPSKLSGTLTFQTSATISSPAGSYPIKASGLSSQTYTITYVDGTLTVRPASTPQPTPDTTTKIYMPLVVKASPNNDLAR
jgi:hypothetical protein